MTELDLKYQDLKREYETLKKENERLRVSNSLLEKQLKEQKDHIADVNKMVVTNADRIRNMSDKDLAIFLEAVECNSHGWCDECETLKGNPCNGLKDESNALVKERLDWLKEKVE